MNYEQLQSERVKVIFELRIMNYIFKKRKLNFCVKLSQIKNN